MADPLRCWSINELGTLDEFAFRESAPVPGSESYSVAVWFRASDMQRTQVLCNQGAMSKAVPGWTLFLSGGSLCASITTDDGQVAAVSLSLASKSLWQHATCVIDRESDALRLYLNANHFASEPLPASPITPEREIIAGGYTDPAGGHFDHTFGRGGTGYLDDLRLYAHALSPAEIAALAPRAAADSPAPAWPKPLPAAVFAMHAADRRAPLTIHFDASASDDMRAILWDFGDGQTGLGAQIAHDYTYAGDYRVRLTVVDALHNEATSEQTLALDGQPNPLTIRPVFVNGTEGYACYRIPAIVCAADGSLVAFAEGRVASCSDSTPVIHIVSKRSSDNGHTWGPVQVVGRNVIGSEEFAAQNVSAVVDTVHGTGRIVVVFKQQEHSEWDREIGRAHV